MPATTRYATYRRKSSLINGLTPVKAGNYGIASSPRTSPKTVVFAPNVTPGTYTEPEAPIDEDTPLPPSPCDALFPPSLNPESTQSRRRVPPGKRRSQGYIPRPPNAFMLFRADFVRKKHVPGSIETNHGSLSKIIGNCWKALPIPEKKTWEHLAKQAKAKHQKMYPDYRFRPVHNKAKKLAREAAKAKAVMTPQDEQRCEDVAAMLLDGKKGDELAAAVRDYDTIRGMSGSPMLHAPVPTHPHAFDPLHTFNSPPASYQFARRPSSVPLPGINVPSLPFYLPNPSEQQHMMMSASRPESPISHFARSRMVGRRPSSAAPILNRSWEMPEYYTGQLQPDNEPLPDVNAGIFEQAYLGSSGFSWGAPMSQSPESSFNGGAALQQPDLALSISPLDHVALNENTISSASTVMSAFPYPTPNHPSTEYFDITEFLPPLDPSTSGPSSAFSGSPAPSETSLPMQQQQQAQSSSAVGVNLHAPKPQHPLGYETWDPMSVSEVPMQEDYITEQVEYLYISNGPIPSDFHGGSETIDHGYPFHDDMNLDIPHY